MRLHILWISWLLAVAATSSAKADSFNFTYTQGNEDGFYLSISGTLTASAAAIPGQYTITNVTGTESFSIGGAPSSMANIMGLLSPDTVYGGDDILYTGGLTPYLDEYGFTFTTDGSGSDSNGNVNIAYLTSQSVYTTPYEFGFGTGAFALTDVPEPTSLSLSLGLIGLGFVLRKARGQT